VTAGDKTIGTMGSSAGGHGLALLRLDRAEEAISAGQQLISGGVPLRLRKPDWARFSVPGADAAS
jgi:folate-binding Fe-S cluster repair protein YgfZ